MKMSLSMSVFLMLLCLTVQGQTTFDALEIPPMMQTLPQELQEAHIDFQGHDRAGTWALPTLVALRYGLVVSDTLDQRYDSVAAAQVAIRYLNDLYAEFGDWERCRCAYLYSPAYVRNLQARQLDTLIGNFDYRLYADCIRRQCDTQPITTTPQPSVAVRPSTSQGITYVVKPGDTLSKIAQTYKVKVSDIKLWNHLKSDMIRDQQKLKIYP